MSDTNNTENQQDTSEDEGTINTADNRDTVTDAVKENQAEKTFTQKDIDAIVKGAKADAKKAAKVDFDKSLEGKLILTEDELQAKISEALDAYKQTIALDAVKASIKSEYSLTDEQVSRLSGDTEKELKADAEKIFGTFKKKDAPKLNTGNGDKAPAPDDIDAQISNSLIDLTKRITRK